MIFQQIPKALLFSATFQKRIEFLARSVTSDPIRINVGTTGQANEDITQIVQVFDQDEMKWDWLIRHLAGFCVGKLYNNNKGGGVDIHIKGVNFSMEQRVA
jgi:hypothetical protein